MSARRWIDIEDALVWAYRDQCVERMAADRLGPAAVSMTQVLMRYAELGTWVDGGGRDAGSDPHDDALAIATAVAGLPRDVAALVVLHARTATRPAWDYPARPVLRPVQGRNRAPRIERWVDAGVSLSWCPVAPDWETALAEYGRAEWRVWRGALVVLAWRLRHLPLSRHRILPPSAARAPWLAQPLKFTLPSVMI